MYTGDINFVFASFLIAASPRYRFRMFSCACKLISCFSVFHCAIFLLFFFHQAVSFLCRVRVRESQGDCNNHKRINHLQNCTAMFRQRCSPFSFHKRKTNWNSLCDSKSQPPKTQLKRKREMFGKAATKTSWYPFLSILSRKQWHLRWLCSHVRYNQRSIIQNFDFTQFHLIRLTLHTFPLTAIFN